MRRRNREFEIFSMSALDLFAGAMGAFVLIAIVLLPYYRMKAPVLAEVNALKSALVEEQHKNEELQKELEDAQTLAFLGFTTKAESFVILIDMSGSMEAYETLMDQTVGRLLSSLDASHQVQIVGFQGHPGTLTPWQASGATASMDASRKKSASSFVGRISQSFDGGTPTLKALDAALTYDVDAIILLSDGAPTDADYQKIVSQVTRQNSGNKEIHCIAIGDYNSQPELVRFLTELAKANEGEFIGVS